MKRKWSTPSLSVVPCDIEKLGDINALSDAELKIKLEENGYSFKRTFQSKCNYVHRRIADSEVLISIGENIANFNGYIELNASAAFLWEEMKEPRTASELEQALEQRFNIPHMRAVEDVLDFLKELQDHDMVLVS
ncbi:MAG: PqqD family protein [Coprococcus sp.]